MLTKVEAKKLQTTLKAAGVSATVLAPQEERDFEISVMNSIRGGALVIHPGQVDVKVFPFKDAKQAILWVDETARSREEEIDIYTGLSTKSSHQKRHSLLTESKKLMENGAYFPVGMPDSTKYKVIEGPTLNPGDLSRATAKVRATAPATKLTFLVGRDEHAHFVCVLPKRVEDVPAAHAALRPKSVPEGSPRQGEFFFVPASAAKVTEIEKIIAANPGELQGYWLGASDEGHDFDYRQEDPYHDAEVSEESSHGAPTGILLQTKGTKKAPSVKELYVIGYVFDDRRPDSDVSRHAPLFLPGWHKVVRNLEVRMDDGSNETWD